MSTWRAKLDNVKRIMITILVARINWTLLISALVLTGCVSDQRGPLPLAPEQIPTPLFFFIQQEPFNENERQIPGVDKVQDYLTAVTTGKLVLKDKCLRLKGTDSNIGYLLIWPAELFTPNIKDNEIQILDRNSRVVARVGQEVRMSGGEVGLLNLLPEYVQRQIPPACTGPYWVVGLEVHSQLSP